MTEGNGFAFHLFCEIEEAAPVPLIRPRRVRAVLASAGIPRTPRRQPLRRALGVLRGVHMGRQVRPARARQQIGVVLRHLQRHMVEGLGVGGRARRPGEPALWDHGHWRAGRRDRG
jgi:hypothetical protein